MNTPSPTIPTTRTLEERLLDLPAEQQEEVLTSAARDNEENGNDREIGLLGLYFSLAFVFLTDSQRRDFVKRVVQYDAQIRREVTSALNTMEAA